MITTVIWDWNGTLLDDARYSMGVMNGILAERNMPLIDSVEAYYRAFDFPIRKYYANVGFADEESFAEVSVAWMNAYMAGESACGLRETAAEAMDLLKANGVRQVVVSASEIGNLRKQIDRLGLTGRFDDLRGLNHIYATSKTDVARKWLTDSGERVQNVLFIGDTTHDFEVASALGCRCVLVSGGHQARAALETCGCAVAGTPFKAARQALEY